MHPKYGELHDPTGLRGLSQDDRRMRLISLLSAHIEAVRMATEDLNAAVGLGASDDDLEDGYSKVRSKLGNIGTVLFTEVIDYAAYRARREAQMAAWRLTAPTAPKEATETLAPQSAAPRPIDDLMDLLK